MEKQKKITITYLKNIANTITPQFIKMISKNRHIEVEAKPAQTTTKMKNSSSIDNYSFLIELETKLKNIFTPALYINRDHIKKIH